MTPEEINELIDVHYLLEQNKHKQAKLCLEAYLIKQLTSSTRELTEAEKEYAKELNKPS